MWVWNEGILLGYTHMVSVFSTSCMEKGEHERARVAGKHTPGWIEVEVKKYLFESAIGFTNLKYLLV